MRRPINEPKAVDQSDPLLGDEQDVPELPDLPPRGAQSAKFDFKVPNTVSFESVKDNKNTSPKEELQDVSKLKAQFNALAPDLTAVGWQAAIAAAQDDAMLSRLRKANNSPAPYQKRPKGQHLVDYLRCEWLGKGWDPRKITRKVLSDYDPPLANRIATYEHHTALLPDDVRFAKALARTNAQERKVGLI